MKILVAGDFCPHNRVSDLIEENQFDKIWNDVPSITKDADYCVLNLECPIVERQATPIAKCGPNLKCSSRAADAIKFAGFDCVTLANNHFYDFGEVGVKDTLTALQEKGIDYVGGGVNLKDASKTLFKEVKGKKLAIINCCEREFSIATENSGGSNPLNIVQQYYAIQDARKKADLVIVIIHGGVELFWLPTYRMVEIYRFFIDSGADAVINHHQHCYSGYEVYNGKPIFYGLGNFCFDGIGSGERWSTGYMVILDEQDNNITYDLIPYYQCTSQVGIDLMSGDDKEHFYCTINDYNHVISDKNKSEAIYLDWCNQTQKSYKRVLNPFYNRYTAKLFDGFWGMKLINLRKWLYTKDMLNNESHIERVRLLVDQMIDKTCK